MADPIDLDYIDRHAELRRRVRWLEIQNDPGGQRYFADLVAHPDPITEWLCIPTTVPRTDWAPGHVANFVFERETDISEHRVNANDRAPHDVITRLRGELNLLRGPTHTGHLQIIYETDEATDQWNSEIDIFGDVIAFHAREEQAFARYFRSAGYLWPCTVVGVPFCGGAAINASSGAFTGQARWQDYYDNWMYVPHFGSGTALQPNDLLPLRKWDVFQYASPSVGHGRGGVRHYFLASNPITHELERVALIWVNTRMSTGPDATFPAPDRDWISPSGCITLEDDGDTWEWEEVMTMGYEEDGGSVNTYNLLMTPKWTGPPIEDLAGAVDEDLVLDFAGGALTFTQASFATAQVEMDKYLKRMVLASLSSPKLPVHQLIYFLKLSLLISPVVEPWEAPTWTETFSMSGSSWDWSEHVIYGKAPEPIRELYGTPLWELAYSFDPNELQPTDRPGYEHGWRSFDDVELGVYAFGRTWSGEPQALVRHGWLHLRGRVQVTSVDFAAWGAFSWDPAGGQQPDATLTGGNGKMVTVTASNGDRVPAFLSGPSSGRYGLSITDNRAEWQHEQVWYSLDGVSVPLLSFDLPEEAP